MRHPVTSVLVAALLFGTSQISAAVADEEIESRADAKSPPNPLAFERSARLVFKAHCFHCHGEEGVTEGGLDLRLRHLIVTGGDSGAAIEPHRPAESYLLQRMIDGDMPPEEAAIRPTKEEIETVRRWIRDGAITVRPEPKSPNDLPKITPEDREHWAFRPIELPEVPSDFQPSDQQRIRTPIDAFVLRRLNVLDTEDTDRGFSPDADRRTLIRRATFDLHGLPPTPEDVNRFLADESDESWANLINRLLASPRYGERWGRHWLDVVGYADSEGASEKDTPRPHAYRYRDYVIDSFNADLPWDRFLTEQLAGDELVTSPPGELTAEDRRLLTATGFLRMAPDGTGDNPPDPIVARNETIAGTIEVVSSSLMGMTVACAQCHDHRFDPILHEDYYRMRAVFAPALNVKAWKRPSDRRIKITSPEQQAENERIEAEAKKAEARKRELEQEAVELVFAREVEKLPEELRSRAEDAFRTEADKRTDDQKKLLSDYPSVNVVDHRLHLYLPLFKEGQAKKKEIDNQSEVIRNIREKAPGDDYLRALTEYDAPPVQTFVFHRGDPEQPTDKVSPGGLRVVDHLVPVDFSENNPELPTTGRRLAFANHLTHPDHPLTARVLANRVWMHHFGRGLVTTPGDFGRVGEPPTHPELLDWLARDLIDGGWTLKRMHRQIMLSSVYRQSSRRFDPAFDPDNALYARQSIRRLEAEAIRDAILKVSGSLADRKTGDSLTTVSTTEEGNTVVPSDLNSDQTSPRSVYVQHRRTTPLAMLEAFDMPLQEPNCTSRTASTVATQSLMMMNSETLVVQSERLADRLIEQCGNDVTAQVELVWVTLFAAPPTKEEQTRVSEFLREQTAAFAETDEKSAHRMALASLCQTLMNSNRFLYVD